MPRWEWDVERGEERGSGERGQGARGRRHSFLTARPGGRARGGRTPVPRPHPPPLDGTDARGRRVHASGTGCGGPGRRQGARRGGRGVADALALSAGPPSCPPLSPRPRPRRPHPTWERADTHPQRSLGGRAGGPGRGQALRPRWEGARWRGGLAGARTRSLPRADFPSARSRSLSRPHLHVAPPRLQVDGHAGRHRGRHLGRRLGVVGVLRGGRGGRRHGRGPGGRAARRLGGFFGRRFRRLARGGALGRRGGRERGRVGGCWCACDRTVWAGRTGGGREGERAGAGLS